MNKTIAAKKWLYFVLYALLFAQCAGEKKKEIVYVNSYHKGHPSSDQIMDAFVRNMPADSFHIHSFYMDTKRNPSKEFIQNKANDLLDSIVRIGPDLLVVSDDNAVKYLTEPNLAKIKSPVIFCGVNWTDSEYDLPQEQVTGILEILPVSDAVKQIKKYYPEAKRLLVLNENTTTSRKEKQILDTMIQNAGVNASFLLVDDFEQWKNGFQTGNENYDLIYISTHAAIKEWNREEAIRFVSENTKVPTFTCEDFMIPYTVLGVTKVAEEHGIWAANTAKQILNGMSPGSFPVTRNVQSNTMVNVALAEKIELDAAFLNKKDVLLFKGE